MNIREGGTRRGLAGLFVSSQWVGRCRGLDTDWLLPQNGELTMLGEITHLQGIIDDLVVLTADPHKLPPASEQVRPALGSRVRTGTRTNEGMVLPSCGDSRKRRESLREGPCGKRTR